jgi:Outer membrane protein beta-barrel domain
MKRFLLFTFLILVGAEGYAQLTSCAQTLRLAQSTYEQGRLHEVPVLLQNCINNGFNKQEKVAAYKLLTLSYLYLEEPEKANEAMLNLLRTDHYFEINTSTDPAEFVALYKTFRTKPIYRIGGKIGVNATSPNVAEAVEANDGVSEYKYKIGIQAHVVAEIPFHKNLDLNVELGFLQRNFAYTNNVSFVDTTFTTEAAEKQTWLSLPISVHYQLEKIKFQPYIALGVQADFLLGSNLTGSRTRQGYQFVEEKSFELKTQRESLNLSAIAAVGARLPIGGGYVVTEIRFLYGLTNVNSADTAFGVNSDLAFAYGYADSVYKLNSVSVTAGYVYNIFNPKKLNKKK